MEAFPWDSGSRYLLRDRDAIYGEEFCETAKWMGIREVLTAPRSPWQNAYAERLIGSIRRECLDHVLVFREAGLRQALKQFFAYYERCRTHLSLKKDAPVGRAVELPSFGEVIQIPQVGGLHHLYTQSCLIDKDFPALGVRMRRTLRSFAMRSLVSCGRTLATRGLILGATDTEYRSLR